MQVVYDDNKTYITNIAELAESFNIAAADLLVFMAAQCACETDRIDALYGQPPIEHIIAAIDTYRTTFVECQSCASLDTTLEVSRSRPQCRITCNACGRKKIRTMAQYPQFLEWIRQSYVDTQ